MTALSLDRHGDGLRLAELPRKPFPAQRVVRGSASRYLFFTNECVGLGHLRRNLTLAAAVQAADPTASSLIVTGSPGDLAYPVVGIDTVRLPALHRDETGTYGARTLGSSPHNILALRSQVALATALAWNPDVVVVDKLPLGLGEELLAALTALRRNGSTRIVLGLRDIEDDPDAVRRRWAQAGTKQVLRELYDEVLVYGPGGSPDALDCVGSDDLGLPVRHVGYVGAPLPPTPAADLAPGYLLVTTGGGADGFTVANTVIKAARLQPIGTPMVVVAGPLMAHEQVEALRESARGLDVRVETSRRDLAAVVVGARAVVCMAGYNTVSEVLRAAKPTLLVPRARPSAEQLIRARALAEKGTASMLHPDDMSPATMATALHALLRRTPPHVDPAQYDGAARAATALMAMARR
jgi:predicted glycosyltransferase